MKYLNLKLGKKLEAFLISIAPREKDQEIPYKNREMMLRKNNLGKISRLRTELIAYRKKRMKILVYLLSWVILLLLKIIILEEKNWNLKEKKFSILLKLYMVSTKINDTLFFSFSVDLGFFGLITAAHVNIFKLKRIEIFDYLITWVSNFAIIFHIIKMFRYYLNVDKWINMPLFKKVALGEKNVKISNQDEKDTLAGIDFKKSLEFAWLSSGKPLSLRSSELKKVSISGLVRFAQLLFFFRIYLHQFFIVTFQQLPEVGLMLMILTECLYFISRIHIFFQRSKIQSWMVLIRTIFQSAVILGLLLFCIDSFKQTGMGQRTETACLLIIVGGIFVDLLLLILGRFIDLSLGVLSWIKKRRNKSQKKKPKKDKQGKIQNNNEKKEEGEKEVVGFLHLILYYKSYKVKKRQSEEIEVNEKNELNVIEEKNELNVIEERNEPIEENETRGIRVLARYRRRPDRKGYDLVEDFRRKRRF